MTDAPPPQPTSLVRLLMLSVAATAPLVCAADAPDARFVLPAPPLELVRHEESFRPFALRVGEEVERLLGVPAAVDDPATLRVLLSTRVHLAHHFADNEKAVSTAAWIRSLQSSPADRAFAGLTTLAAVAARRANPGVPPHDARYRETFRREFARELAALPATSDIVAMLRGQREKIAAISEATLIAETREVIGAALARRGHCSLVEADQIVRVRHRMVSILPVRDETLAALDAAIAER